MECLNKGYFMIYKAKLKIMLIVLFSFITFFETFPKESSEKELIISIINTFKRSLKHWDIDYETLKTGKAGAACIPWNNLNHNFLTEEIFIALGYSWQIETEKVSMKAAMEGCERMRKYNKITEICQCEPILFNEEIRLKLPKNFQISH